MIKIITLSVLYSILLTCQVKNDHYEVKEVYDKSLYLFKNYKDNTDILPNQFLAPSDSILNFSTLFQYEHPIFNKQNGISYIPKINNWTGENISGSFYNWLSNQSIINLFNDTINLKILYLGHLEQKENYKSFILLVNYAPYDTTPCQLKSFFLINYINKNITSIIKIGGIVTDCLSLVTDWTIQNNNGSFTYKRFLDDLDIDNSIIKSRGHIVYEIYYYKFTINNKGHIEIYD